MSLIVLAFEGFGSGAVDISLLAVFSGLVFYMVVLRLVELGRREAGLMRSIVLAEAGLGLVKAQTKLEIEQVASAAGRAMLEGSGDVEIVAAGTPGQEISVGWSLPLR